MGQLRVLCILPERGHNVPKGCSDIFCIPGLLLPPCFSLHFLSHTLAGRGGRLASGSSGGLCWTKMGVSILFGDQSTSISLMVVLRVIWQQSPSDRATLKPGALIRQISRRCLLGYIVYTRCHSNVFRRTDSQRTRKGKSLIGP